MAATLLDRPPESVDPEAAEAPSVVVSGPDGAEYDFAIPDGATPAEVAAIAASVSATLSMETDPEDPGDTSSFDAWTWCGRVASTGCRRQATGSAEDPWKYSGRPGLF